MARFSVLVRANAGSESLAFGDTVDVEHAAAAWGAVVAAIAAPWPTVAKPVVSRLHVSIERAVEPRCPGTVWYSQESMSALEAECEALRGLLREAAECMVDPLASAAQIALGQRIEAAIDPGDVPF